MINGHPTYPNPTITEAICDIHFRLPRSKEWKPSLPGELFKHIQDEYPEMEPVPEMGLQLEVGPSGTSTKISMPPQKVRFKHATRPLILQLTEHALSISALAPYQGWKVLQTDALAAWQRFEEVLKPESISRIGLRYINQIAKETDQEPLKNWLVANDYIPEGVLRSVPGVLLRVQVHLDAQNMLIITLGDTKAGPESEHGTIIFDIDRITEREIGPEQDLLEQEMDRLHTDVWNIFSSATGEQLITLLERGQ